MMRTALYGTMLYYRANIKIQGCIEHEIPGEGTFCTHTPRLLRGTMGPFKKYIRIELGCSTAEGTCRRPSGLNPHGPQQVPADLAKTSLIIKLEIKYYQWNDPTKSSTISNLAYVL